MLGIPALLATHNNNQSRTDSDVLFLTAMSSFGNSRNGGRRALASDVATISRNATSAFAIA